MLNTVCEQAGNSDGTFKSSVDKFFDQEALKAWAEKFNAKPGDLILILAGDTNQTRKALCELRLEMGNRLELRDQMFSNHFGLLTFHCLNGMKKASVSMPCTIRLPLLKKKILTKWIPIRSSASQCLRYGDQWC